MEREAAVSGKGRELDERSFAPVSEAMSEQNAGHALVHWYDVTCPFCYVSQPVVDSLTRDGVAVVELPYQVHPEVPESGVMMGDRTGPMYDALRREASAAGLPLDWQPKLPNSRIALAAAEWIREERPAVFRAFQGALYAAHFSQHRDVGDVGVVLAIATEQGADAALLRVALDDGSAARALAASEAAGRRVGVTGTPAWTSRSRTLTGLADAARLGRFAKTGAA